MIWYRWKNLIYRKTTKDFKAVAKVRIGVTVLNNFAIN